MIQGWRLYLRARATRSLLTLAAVDLVAIHLAGVTVFEVSITQNRLPRFTPAWEALPVVLAVLAPALIAPRLATWELSGRARLRIRAGLLATLVTTLPATLPWLAHFRLPADARWWDISCNVTFFAAIALIATAALGTLAGPLIGLLAYLMTIALQQVSPEIATFLPISGAKTNLQAHPAASLAMTTAAVIVWTQTTGQSRLVRTLHRND